MSYLIKKYNLSVGLGLFVVCHREYDWFTESVFVKGFNKCLNMQIYLSSV